MENGRAEELHPASLPLGARVGPWRVVGWRGRGAYGAVYRAVRVGREKRGSVALKLAVRAGEPRFEREATLLSRLRHPNVPELYEHGQWQQGERAYPYLVMQWVEGLPLYDWAAARNPSSRQLLLLLAQLARALGAIHELGGVHRDVKGDNVLVRMEDSRAFLVDAGLGSYPGASPLTFMPLPPGTEAYRSPEAWRFARELGRKPGAHYEAQQADDVFALGVTAYRLVTDEYPPSTDPGEDKAGIWCESGAGLRPPLELNPRLSPWLSALTLRMLSVRPELRARAMELARMLEQEAEQADAEAALPAFAWETLPPAAWPQGEGGAAMVLGHRPRHRDRSVVYASEERDRTAGAEAARLEAEAISRALARREGGRPGSAEHRARLSWLVALTASCGAMALVANRAAHREPVGLSAVAQVEARDGGGEEAETAGLAEEVLSTPEERVDLQRADAAVAEDVPPKPLSGQRRPDGKGRCQHRRETAINGGCWIGLLKTKPPCDKGEYEWEGACYYPAWETPRGPTSTEP
jgi:eukaryotic-like serine/threonine-protein kinase